MKSDELIASPYGFIASNRRIVTLGDICVEKDGIQTGPFGSQLHSADYVDAGTPIIMVEHLGENVIKSESTPFVSDEDMKRLVKYTMKPGDIIFSRVGYVDKRALVKDKHDGWLFSGSLLRIRPNPKLVDATYLSYFFGLPRLKKYMGDVSVGATRPSINTSILKSIPVVLPEMRVQKVVGEILSLIDERIASNIALSKTLENIAQSIFKAWFIDFDPVKAKMSGSKPAGMDDATAALFPDAMVESEIGMIPRSWELTSAGVFCPFKYGKALPASSRVFGEVPVYGSNGVVGTHNKALTSGPSIIVGRKGTVGTVNLELAPCWVIDTAFYVDTKELADIYLAYFQLQNLGLSEMNSDGAVPGLNRDNAQRLIFTVGNLALRKRFGEIAHQMFMQIANLKEENSSLTALRDSLLPRLISGELRIPDELLAS